MVDVFRTVDAALLLENKYVVIMGSSIQRCIYKDLICCLQLDQYITDANLRSKGEKSFLHDQLLEGGKFSEMTNGIDYREVRQYVTEYHRVKFYFITRCYSAYIEKILDELKESDVKPDVVIFNSCIWDVTRYGNMFINGYRENLQKLMEKLKNSLPEECLVIWNCALPVSKEAKGGVIIPECEAMTNTLRLDLILANHLAAKIVQEAGYDVIDFQFYLRHQLHRRAEDGIHWDMTAHRRFTNLFMTHIAEAWGVDLPDNSSQVNPSLLKNLQESISTDVMTQASKQSINSRPIAIAKRRIPLYKNQNTFRNGDYEDQWQNQRGVIVIKPFIRPYSGPVRNNVVQDYNSNILSNPVQHYRHPFSGPSCDGFDFDSREPHNRGPFSNNVSEHLGQSNFNRPIHQDFVFHNQEPESRSSRNSISEQYREPEFNGPERQNSRIPFNNNFEEQCSQPSFNPLEHDGFVLDGPEQLSRRAISDNIAERYQEHGFNVAVQQNWKAVRNSAEEQGWEPPDNNVWQGMKRSGRPLHDGPVKLFGDPHYQDTVALHPGFEHELHFEAQDLRTQRFNNMDAEHTELSFEHVESNYAENCPQFNNIPDRHHPLFSPHSLTSRNSDINNPYQSSQTNCDFNDENAGVKQDKFSYAGNQYHASRNNNRALKDKNVFIHQNKQIRPFVNSKNVGRHNARRPAFLSVPLTFIGEK